VSFHPITIAQALRMPGIAPVDARVLLQHVLGVEHAYLVAHSERVLQDEERVRFLQLHARRSAGEPVAYLIGWREFYGRRFRVDPSVLIPRPETELLVELALERIPVDRPSRVLDLGTGSGNIAITLALERPAARVIAIDVSAAALTCARGNAAALGAGNVEFLQGAWFSPLSGHPGRFDLVVSNPPYVAEGDPHLAQGDVRFEPRSALAAGGTGMDSICEIAAKATRLLVSNGMLLLEHGHDQEQAVADVLGEAGYVGCFCVRDLAGHPRVSGGRRNPTLDHRIPPR